MKFVTSISPHRIERQQFCIANWQSYGLPILAVQSSGEIEYLKDKFPGVEFVVTESVCEHYFDAPKCPSIKSLIQHCDGGIIVNSDISFEYKKHEFDAVFIETDPTHVVVGIRKDLDPYMGVGKINRYGIDVFRLNKIHHACLPDNPYGMGQPGWDYWVLLHLYYAGFTIHTQKQGYIVHENHDRAWEHWKMLMAQSLLSKEFNSTPNSITGRIHKITGRR